MLELKSEYLLAIAIGVGITVGLWLLDKFLIGRLKAWSEKTANDWDDVGVQVLDDVSWLSYVAIGSLGGLQWLNLSESVERLIEGSVLIILVWQGVRILQRLIEFGIKKRLERGGSGDKMVESAMKIINRLAGIILWSVAGLFVLSNFGINVTSLIASLGIGGIAIAFALQNVLGDLFSSLAIYLDKPFEAGDFIKVGKVSGTVQDIGIKTTRIKSLAGQEVVLPNKYLTEAEVNNYKRMLERRIAFEIGLVYQTPQAKLQEFPEIVEKVFENLEMSRFGRAHFKEFGESALVFEIVYYVTDRKYEEYVKVEHELNLRLNRALNENGYEVAYPTSMVIGEGEADVSD